ncbi:MAG TPA: type VI secretion system contractile sheath small subunit [Myxococcaceae bacterium]|jgi:type VI secretion system protein ImpB|nr:type VI secretion system contractile sheath small subunit [Myxococcaceae bacterium]
MAKEGTVAPKERVNIVYKSEVAGAQQDVELPLKMLMVGDYTGRKDDRVMEDRAPINVDQRNFNEVMAKQELRLDISVEDKLTGAPNSSLPVSLKFESLADFGPEGVVNQVPELRKLQELRAALTALKGPLGNVPAFRKKIQALLGEDATREKLMAELGLK